jgi:predicted HD superfamily hydrolase involved in NAD metabolism
METAMGMADRLNVEKEKVYIAALLHDYAKDLKPEELLELADKNSLLTCHAEKVQPDLLHGPVGAWLCRSEVGIADEAVLQAIRYHSTGHAAMNELDVVVYLADLIEPGRSYKGVEELREICDEDIYAGLLYAFDCTLLYVIEREMLIHPYTIEARNRLLTIKR